MVRMRTINFPPNATTVLILTIVAAGLQALIIGLDSFQDAWVPYVILLATVALRMITAWMDWPVQAYRSRDEKPSWLTRVFTDSR